ncbi:ABC transporter substrate-binding protein [Mobiluncus mulieris]|uniref:ABC transporter substrate-binding protein n=1 Tax=Mobiluncus mulieris TaxID=2052 RepID=UPI00019F8F21|nr:ABC transporter substrate-binding protein [Mobiluncus mulieris]EEJ52969.1 ABC transporter, solute-binding protein [Mobiluncus mulieris ATCC 35243]MCU9971796.1 ABC transporter substrate-binding protein [Mobiluncus mulieris]MCU9975050.1 ABC transporter substrate-binding protein [Mobiluncus mulieris]MCV0002014.1 ABC transporter substrate-binding protein [Mobiluncus mulieris]NMW91573.1 ABC transporter substrate-binding protein [Mobiluncus mulieris]
MRIKKLLAGLALSGLVISMAACSSGGSSGGASTASGGKDGDFSGHGPITYVQGKDNAAKMQGLLDKWNEKHPDEKVKFIELSTSPDEQRQAMINNAQTKSDAFCVESVDVVWVGEFAAHRMLMPLPKDQFPEDKFFGPVWQTGLYRDNMYAVPFSSDGAMLYYRSDFLKEAGITEPPKNWDEMKTQCEAVRKLPGHENIGCYGGQLAKYEGATCNISEAINAGGGVFFDKDGKAKVNSAEAEKGLDYLVEGFKSGFIPKEALTYKEEEGRAAFEAGRVLFYRNWPYQYVLNEKAIPGKFGVAPLPAMGDHPGASTLGGHNVGISSYCKNKATALDFVKWFSSEESQQYLLKEESLAPVYDKLYTDPESVKQYPYLPTLAESIKNAVPRPQVAKYGDVTAAIQDAIYPALQGEKSSKDALEDLQKKLESLKD